MPPSVALVLALGFSGFLLWRDSQQEPKPSAALWIPFAWIFIVGSRFVSQWLTVLGVPGFGGVAMEDGSPIGAAFFLVLILAGAIVLGRRRIAIASLASQNVWLTVFFVYCFLAISWSDFPLVAFKRWIKVLGHPIVALIILTERDPLDAIKRVFQRTSYVLLPLSVVFIKYSPQYGRGFDSWTGAGYNRGVALTKNDLGYGLMVFALFFFWKLLTLRRNGQLKAQRDEAAITVLFLAMLGWLFMMADSATSLACTMIGASTMIIVGSRVVNK